MIQPVNGHLVIEPVAYEAFMASERETYQEIGVIVAIDQYGAGVNVVDDDDTVITLAKVGDKVYFDAWLAAKYPKSEGKNGEFYWLVKWEDVRAIEHVEPK
jgi:co-chaperonin GroES (HSP10)